MSTHTAQTQLQLVGKLILSGELHCETGLHIGAGKGSLEIGGADNPVVKDAFGLPYIPGSSLRGRIRSLLENALGLTAPGRNPGRMDRVAGEALDTRAATPARLAIYDAPLDAASITAQMRENLDDEITEVKSENAIDRITSQANPRTLERVPAGARFHVRMVLDVLCEEDKVLAARLIEGLRLLEDDALGGGGSRGSGRVRFANLKLVWRNRTFYSTGSAETELASAADLTAVQALANDASFGEKLAS
jgi:CRISPR-associated protein Csm3